MQVINKMLYRRLKSTFGSVEVVNLGEPQARKVDRKSKKVDITNFGETYKVCCPLCDDRRYRCLISHMYGTDDEFGRPQYRLICCFNAACPLEMKKPEAYEKLKDYLLGRKAMDLRKPHLRVSADSVLELRWEWPGKMVRLEDLQPDHEAIQYLRSRNFNPVKLSKFFDVQWCESSENFAANRRIIIPIYKDGVMFGWQSRLPREIDWKNCGIPKYHTAKHTRKGSWLYNLDAARKHKVAVLCEGATDVWRIGPCAAAYFGGALTAAQVRLILTSFIDYSVIMLPHRDVWEKIDSDRKVRDKWEEQFDMLESSLNGRFFPVRLPSNIKDLAELSDRKTAQILLSRLVEQQHKVSDLAWGKR
jgi:hypothetical protein